jgi:hypothetical protein
MHPFTSGGVGEPSRGKGSVFLGTTEKTEKQSKTAQSTPYLSSTVYLHMGGSQGNTVDRLFFSSLSLSCPRARITPTLVMDKGPAFPARFGLQRQLCLRSTTRTVFVLSWFMQPWMDLRGGSCG